jgi:putative photosynthetic complex assembly protein
MMAARARVALVCAALAVAAWGHAAWASEPFARQVVLFFADRADGAVLVTRADDGSPVATLAPGEDAFVRGVMRGLVRERKRTGTGAAQPFVLGARADGRLVIEDPATAQRIVLDAFGRDNARAFARFLKPQG